MKNRFFQVTGVLITFIIMVQVLPARVLPVSGENAGDFMMPAESEMPIEQAEPLEENPETDSEESVEESPGELPEEVPAESPEPVETPPVESHAQPQGQMPTETTREELPEEPSEEPPGNTPEEPSAPSAVVKAAGEIPQNAAVVKTYEELYSALAANNQITTVYFGANITMKLGGIRIHSSKPNVVISGLNPQEPERTEPYTLTDHGSGVITDTIYIGSSALKSLIITDLNIIGRNFYGPVGVLESELTDNLELVFRRISYSGPQFLHHRRGTVRVIDCTANIHNANGGSVNQEFSEVKHLRFEGNNAITTATSNYSVFWHPYGGTFELAQGASLSLTALELGTLFGVYYADAGKVSVSVGAGAALSMAISGTVNIPAQAHLTGITVSQGGVFRLKTTQNAFRTVLTAEGSIHVKSNALFSVEGFSGAAYTMLEVSEGDVILEKNASLRLYTGNVYAALLGMHGGKLTLRDPHAVLFYNPGGRTVTALSGSITFYAEAEQINRWTLAGAGGFSDFPPFRWKLPGGGNIILQGSIGTAGNFSALTSNWPASLPEAAPSAENLDLKLTRVLSIGRLPLALEIPFAGELSLSGITAPAAALYAHFTQDGESVSTGTVTAGASGEFLIPLPVALKASTEVTAEATLQYLYASVVTTVAEDGALQFSVPSELVFKSARIAGVPLLGEREDSDFSLVVTDLRGVGHRFEIFARAISPLARLGAPEVVLKNALVFADAGGSLHFLDADEPVPVYTQPADEQEDTTVIQWAENRGPLVLVPSFALLGQYTTKIEWIISDAP